VTEESVTANRRRPDVWTRFCRVATTSGRLRSLVSDCGTDCGTGTSGQPGDRFVHVGRKGANGSSKPPATENAPPGKEGRFWGYYREERYVSLYMWIRGR
jgi:hypothetical protein